MGVFIDLYAQVQKVLRRVNGGTDNPHGWAEGVVQRYQNQDAGVLPIGTLVRMVTIGTNNFVTEMDVEEGDTLVGIVKGTYDVFGPTAGQFRASNPSNGQPVAVMTAGTTLVLGEGTINRGEYAYAGSTAGRAKALAIKRRGAFGRFLSLGSNSALVRLPLTSIFTGSEIVTQYGQTIVSDLVNLDFSSGFAVHSNSAAEIGAIDLAYEQFEIDAQQVKVANSSNYFTANSPATAVETLRPTSDVTKTASSTITYSSGTTGWNLVDEVALDTGDYYAGADAGPWYIVHGFPATSLTNRHRITSVTLNRNGSHALGTADGEFYVRDPQTGAVMIVNAYNPGGAQPETYTMTTRPWDSRPWTVDDLRHFQFGVGQSNNTGFGNGMIAYQVYVEVNYTNPVTVEQALNQLGAGGGAGSSNSHNILSASHLDTLAGTVVRGDVITGNSTPKWARLPIAGSAPSNAAFISDGTDAKWEWPAPVHRITASSSNVLWGQVDLRAGTGAALSVASNTITISSTASGGGGGGGAALTVTEEDASPSVASVDTLVFPNGSVTDLGGGNVMVRDVPRAFIGARVYRSSDVAVSDSTATTIEFNAEEFDTDGFHDNSTNPDRLTIPAGMGGKYLILASVGCPADTDGERIVYIYKNGAGGTLLALSDGRAPPNVAAVNQTTTVADLAAGDYVIARYYQSSGASQNIQGLSDRTHFLLVKLDSGKVGSGIGAKAYNSTTQSVNDDTLTALTLDSEEFDTDGFHSTSSNTSRMTIPAGLGGKYLLTASGYFGAADADGVRDLRFRTNGSTEIRGNARLPGSTAGSSTPNLTVIADLAAGDYVEVLAYQNSGAAMNIGFASTNVVQTQFSIMRLDSGTSGPPQAKEAYCSADTAITAATTWTDITGLSLSLEAGTWDVHAYAYGDDDNAGSTSMGLAIHNGTTQVSSSASTKTTGAAERFQLSVGALITLTGTTTVKVQGMSTRASSSTTFLKSDTFSGIGVANTACRVRAIRVTP